MPSLSAFRSIASFSFFLLLAVATILVRSEWSPAFHSSIDVDTSYRVILNSVVEQGLVFGQDIVITWGPLAYLVMPDLHPDMSHFKILTGSLYYVAFFAIVFKVFRLETMSWAGWVGLILLWNAAVIYGVLEQLLLFALPLFVYAMNLSPKLRIISLQVRYSLLALIAVAALTKFTYFILAFYIVTIVSASGFKYRDSQRFDIAVLVTLVLLVWVLAGQPVSAIGAFVSNSLEIVSAYGSSLSLNGGHRELFYVCLFFLGASPIAATVLLGIPSRPYIVTLLAIMVWGAFGLIGFKTGFVRFSDGHLIQGFWYLAATGTACFLVHKPESFRDQKVLAAASVGALIVPWLLLAGTIEIYFNKAKWPPRVLAGPDLVVSGVRSAKNYFDHGDELYREGYERGLNEIRRNSFIPEVSGSVDIYPDAQSLILAYDMDYRPRLSYQSVNTVTSDLSSENSKNLLREDAPDVLLFDLSTIDKRLPALGENLSWPIIWTRYMPRSVRSDFLVLDRLAEPREFMRVEHSSREIQIDEVVSVPPELAHNLWVELVVEPSTFGRLASLFYKLPILHIDIEFENGRRESWRFMHEIGRSGFLLSPLIENKEEFALFPIAGSETLMESKRVKSFTIRSEWNNLRFFRPGVSTSFYTLTIPRVNEPTGEQRNYLTELELIEQLLGDLDMGEREPFIYEHDVTGENRRVKAIRALAPYDTFIDVPLGAKVFGFSLEVESDSWTRADSIADGVIISVTGILGDRSEVQLAEILVDPTMNADQRSGERLDVELPKNIFRLKIDVNIRGNGAHDATSIYEPKFGF